MIIRRNKALRVAVAKKDMTFAELADRAGLHPQTISRVYNGHWVLSRPTAERVAKVLDSTPEELDLVPRGPGAVSIECSASLPEDWERMPAENFALEVLDRKGKVIRTISLTEWESGEDQSLPVPDAAYVVAVALLGLLPKRVARKLGIKAPEKFRIVKANKSKGGCHDEQ